MNQKSNHRVIGERIPRLDAREKVLGRAIYTTDLFLPGMLYGKVLRSPHPHARVVRIDTSLAEALEGVKAVLTFKNTTGNKFNASASHVQTIPPYQTEKDQRIFTDVVRYIGDEVAAVAAVNEDTAATALDLIKVKYDILPPVYDPLEAENSESPDIHPHCRQKNIVGNPIEMKSGDADSALDGSDYILEEHYRLPVQKQCQLETQVAVASFNSDGKLTVWSPTQAPHPCRRILAEIFNLPLNKVRVLNPPYVGGAFGVRIGLSGKAEPIAAALAMAAGQPVKIAYNRREDFIASDTRHGGYITVKLGLDQEGNFQVLELKSILNGGAYCSWSADVNGAIGARALTVYKIPHVSFTGYSVYTNTTPAGACRGFGAVQPTFALEMTVNKAADLLKMDPLKLRLRNIIRPGDNWIAPFPCRSSGLKECLEYGAMCIGWEERKYLKEQNQKSDRYKKGLGVAIGNHVSSCAPFQTDYTGAILSVLSDGSVQLACGLVEMGTGTKTTLAQIAAESLGVSPRLIDVKLGDTEGTPYDVGCQASRSCYTAGAAVLKVARDVRKQIIDYVACKTGYLADEIRIDDSLIFRGTEQILTLTEIVRDADYHNRQFSAVGIYESTNALSWQAHFALVTLDNWTGRVTVDKLVAAHDIGKAVNPSIVEGQIEGGAVMGLGYALGEEIRYSQDGCQLNNNFQSYILPTAADVGPIKTILVEPGEPSGPYGARGVGENAVAPVAPAVAGAVINATGVHFNVLPLTPERVLKGLRPQSGTRSND